MRILGLDVGSKTIGVAVSDPFGWTAQGLEIIAINEKKDNFGVSRLQEIIDEYKVEKVVIGLPRNMNGTESDRSALSREFGEKFEQAFSLPVIFQDERLTTKQAERMLIEEGDVSRKKRKTVIDKLAAVLILQNYLDSHIKL